MKRQRIAVAVSGGRDSTALWHATVHAAAAVGRLEVIALHVHHGLLPEADDWVAHLQRQARRWAACGLPVSLHWQRLHGAPARGESTEAWARRERYAALTEMAHELGVGIVLLAHHRRDQAETFLLQALRGAGAAGLSAMPREALRNGITWARPWLEQPREAIEAYVRRHRLGYVQDPSNADARLARGRLRQSVWPQLDEAFEHAEIGLAASARRAQEASACLKELAAQDLQATCTSDGALQVPKWLLFSTARRANLLRAWLAQNHGAGIPESLVQRLMHELPQARAARWPLGPGQLRCHAGLLRFAASAELPQAAPDATLEIDLSRIGRHELPDWGGAFEVRVVASSGLSPLRLRHCELRARSGGENFQRTAGSVPRSLKKQYQSQGLPAWQRDGPLVYAGGELLFVPGLGIDARRHADAGRPMLALSWLRGTMP